MTKLLLAAALALSLVACKGGGNDEQKKKFVDICASSMDNMKSSPEDIQTAMSNVMLSCSKACDMGDKTSCGHIDDFMKTTCGAVASICEGMCSDDTKSPSLKKASCDNKPK